MFWDYLDSTIQILVNMDTHLVILLYLFVMLSPTVIIFIILEKKHALTAKYFRKLFLPIIEAIAVAVTVLTLFPVILGLGDNALWHFPMRIMKLSPGGFLGLLGILITLAYIIDVIPKFRKLQSLKTLVLGGISLIFVQIFLSFINPTLDIELLDFIPGFWFICGTILIAGVLSKLGHFVFVAFTRVLGNKFNLHEEVAELLILPIIATLGFLPVFIYGAWLS